MRNHCRQFGLVILPNAFRLRGVQQSQNSEESHLSLHGKFHCELFLVEQESKELRHKFMSLRHYLARADFSQIVEKEKKFSLESQNRGR